MGEGVTDDEQQELFEERAGIRQYDGGMDRESAERAARADVERYRHQCEVNYLVELGHKEGRRGTERYLALVAQKRGNAAAEGLRADAKAAYLERTGRSPVEQT